MWRILPVNEAGHAGRAHSGASSTKQKADMGCALAHPITRIRGQQRLCWCKLLAAMDGPEQRPSGTSGCMYIVSFSVMDLLKGRRAEEAENCCLLRTKRLQQLRLPSAITCSPWHPGTRIIRRCLLLLSAFTWPLFLSIANQHTVFAACRVPLVYCVYRLCTA
jgi:hypothetical protein